MEQLKSLLYSRVSTDKEEQLTSFIQQQKFNDNRFNIIKVFDDRITGTTIKKREGFINMLNYCGINVKFEKHDYIFEIIDNTDIQCIVVSNTSRFCRSVEDSVRTCKILHKQGIKVYFNDLKAFSNDDNIQILLHVYFTIDQQYSEDLSNKSKAGIKRLRDNENMVFCTGSIKGYTLTKGKLIKNEEAPKIYNIFYDYVYNNLSSVKLALKYGYGSSTIRSILSNIKYAGIDKYNNKVNPNIEPIISLELYNKAQEIRQARTNGGRGVNNNTYALSSKIICPICQRNYTYKKGKHKKYGIWSCQSSKARNKINCNSKGISENRINKEIKNILLSGTYENRIAYLIDRQLNELDHIDIIGLKADIKRLDNQIDILLDLLLNQQIDKDRYNKKHTELEEEKKELLIKLEYANNQNQRIEELNNLYDTYMFKIERLKELAINNNFEPIQKDIKNIYLNYGKGFGIYAERGERIDKVVFEELEILE